MRRFFLLYVRIIAMKKYIVAVILIALPVAYWLISPLWRNIKGNDISPDIYNASTTKQVVSVAKGVLVASEHEVAGSVEIFKDGEKITLHFQDLKVTNGPDLRIYLSSSLDIKDAIDLGPIKANIGNVNYDVPAGTDIKKYKNVLIWCRAFRVLFSYAVVE